MPTFSGGKESVFGISRTALQIGNMMYRLISQSRSSYFPMHISDNVCAKICRVGITTQWLLFRKSTKTLKFLVLGR